ncbi:MAG TPA: CBS domain-containing protein [Actinomycetota bacterium]|nr:CBS domain-containing protein [Actinomycetota bacterium]
MQVRDVMTVAVSSIHPRTPVKVVAGLFLRNRISGAPVLDEDRRVVGVVSESDLLPVREGRPRASAAVAADVMTSPVVTLTEDDTVTEAARVLQRHRIKRAPVLRHGRLVGIVTRADLLRPYLRTDAEIAAEAEGELLHPALGITPRTVGVSVDAGIVRLDGRVGDERLRSLVVRLVRAVDGVVDVIDRLEVLRVDHAAAGHHARRS